MLKALQPCTTGASPQDTRRFPTANLGPIASTEATRATTAKLSGCTPSLCQVQSAVFSDLGNSADEWGHLGNSADEWGHLALLRCQAQSSSADTGHLGNRLDERRHLEPKLLELLWLEVQSAVLRDLERQHVIAAGADARDDHRRQALRVVWVLEDALQAVDAACGRVG